MSGIIARLPGESVLTASQLLALADAHEQHAAKLRAIATPPAPDDPVYGDWAEHNIATVEGAARRFHISKSQVRRICQEHDVGRRNGGVWEVSIPRLKTQRDARLRV